MTWSISTEVLELRFSVPFLLQVGVFLSPVGFRTDVIPRWRDLLSLNPMTGVIEGFRWALLGTGDAPLGALAGSAVTVLLLLCTGLLYFRRMERTFADVI